MCVLSSPKVSPCQSITCLNGRHYWKPQWTATWWLLLEIREWFHHSVSWTGTLHITSCASPHVHVTKHFSLSKSLRVCLLILNQWSPWKINSPLLRLHMFFCSLRRPNVFWPPTSLFAGYFFALGGRSQITPEKRLGPALIFLPVVGKNKISTTVLQF